MAEGVFTIQADINPTINQRALEQAAAQISGQLNGLLAKQTKDISITGSIRGFDPKAIQDTAKATGVLSSALDATKKAFSSAADTAKTAFLGITNSVGTTTKSVVNFSQSIVENIKNSSRFNDALAAINRSGSALKGLPDNFKELAAQINSGTSALDRAAAGGNQFAQAIQPITQLTVGIRSALLQVDTGIQSLGASLRQLAAGGKNTGVGLIADETDKLRDKINDLATKTTPQFGQQLKNTFEKAAAQGPQALVDALQKVREVQGTAIAAGGGATVNVSAAIRSALFDIDKDVLSFTDRFAERFTRLVGIIQRDFVAPVKSAIQNAFKDTDLNAGFFESLSVRFGVLKDDGTKTFKALGQALQDTLGNTKIGSPFKGLIEDARDFRTATVSIVDDIKKKFKELQTGSKQGVGVFDFDAATQSGNKFFSTISNAVKAFATGAKEANPLKNLLGGESGGQAGSASLNLLLAPLNAIKAVLGGLGAIASLPFQAIKAGAGVAGPALGIIKNILGQVVGESGLGGLAAGGAIGAAAITTIGVAAIATAAKFETYKVAFEGLFGPGQGQKVIDLALDFDQLTHFSLDTTIQAVEGLAGAIKNIQPTGALAILKEIGGAAAAVGAGGAQVDRVTNALTQISAAGRLTAQDLNQVTQALPDISRTSVYAQIAKDLNVTNQKAKELAQQGLVDSEEGLKAVLTVADQVPGATEAMAKQSQTFKGLLTVVQTQLNKLLIQIGGPLLVAAKVVLQALIIAFKDLAPVIDVVGNVISKVFGFLGKITGLGSVFKSATDGINSSLKETGAAGGVAALGIKDALDAVSAFKNSIVATENLIGPALDQINVNLAKVIATANTTPTGFTGAFLGGIQTLTNALSSQNLVGSRNGLLALKEGLSDLGDIKSPLQLEQRLNELQTFLGTFDVPPEIKKKFEDIFDAGTDQIAKSNTAVQEALTKTQAYADSLKAAADAHDAVGKAIANVTKLQKDHDAQILKESIQAQRTLDQANQSLADSNDRVAESQANLTKILKGASAEDLEKSDLTLASAKLRLRQIVEDEKTALEGEKKAQDALNNTQKTSINLAGLSLDQVRARLKAVRFSLEAQKAGSAAQTAATKTQAEAGKSAEQQSIDAANAAITKRNAELDVKDAIAAQNDLKAKGTVTDPERIAAEKAIVQAKREQAQQIQAQADAQTAFNKLKEKDVAFEDQLTAANKAIQTAKAAAADADFKSQQSLLQARGDIEGENKLLADRLSTQLPTYQNFLDASLKSTGDRLNAEQLLGITLGNDVIPKYKELAGIIAGINANNTGLAIDAVKQQQTLNDLAAKIIAKQTKFVSEQLTLSGGEATVKGNDVTFNATGQKTTVNQLPIADLLKVLTSEAASIQANSGKLFDVDKSEKQILTLFQDPNVVNALVAAILANPSSDIRKIFEKLFASLNIKVEGFAEGGIIEGVPGSFGKLIRAGEFGRREAILPLENRPALQNLMSQPGILNPILSALPRISLPQNQGSPAIDLSPAVSAPQSRGGSGGINTFQEQNKRDQALAKAIVDELKAAGFTGNQINVQNDFTLPAADDPLSNIKVKQMAREVKRQLEKGW